MAPRLDTASLKGLSALREAVERSVRHLRGDATARLMVLGVLIGALGALAAGLFDWIIAGLGMLVLGARDPDLHDVGLMAALFGPVLGGLLAGLAIRYGTRQARPTGIADVIEATWKQGGSLSLRDGLASALAAAAAIGGGQSGGREGPVVQLAGAMSSHLCRRLGVAPDRARVLVAAGAAAGIAASFNTPVGAAFFALEIILGNFAVTMFGPVVAATVTGTVVGQALLGDRIALTLPEFALNHPVELLLYAILGGLAGALSLGFRRSLALADRLGQRLPGPAWLRPVAAGLLTGGIAAAGLPAVLGNGYAAMQAVIGDEGGMGITMLLLVLVGKLVATSLANSGRVGVGLFAPSLFLGAFGGTAFGLGAHALWPELATHPGAYGMVGMGALAAAMTHSPLTIALMLFEMTRNYQVILPVLVALATSGIVVTAFGRRSIYEEQLQDRGVRLDRGREDLVLWDLRVSDLLRTNGVATIAPDAPFEDLAALFLRYHEQEVFVVEESGRLHGVVQLLDIKHLLVHPEPGLRVEAVETREIPSLYDDQPLAEALPHFFLADVDELPVVDGDGNFLGSLRERDLLGALDREVLRHEALLARVRSGDADKRTDFVELPPGMAMRAVHVGDAMAGQTLRELALTRRYQATVIAVVQTDPVTGKERRCAPTADLHLQPGNRLIVMGPVTELDALCSDQLDLAQTQEVPRG